MTAPIKTVVDAQTTSCLCCGRPWRIVRLSCGHEFPTYEFDDEWDGALIACRQCPEEEAVTVVSEHTPGPWTVERTYGFESSNIRVRGAHIATVHAFDALPDPEGSANARLIAAAPDLLSACEAALARFEIEVEIPAPRSLLRHAIAKARGEAL